MREAESVENKCLCVSDVLTNSVSSRLGHS